jgi:AMP deaminase
MNIPAGLAPLAASTATASHSAGQKSATTTGREPIFAIPSIREYFMDLDYILHVIADGPIKSFAYKRLKYLESKFRMFGLVWEGREVAEMKAS